MTRHLHGQLLQHCPALLLLLLVGRVRTISAAPTMSTLFDQADSVPTETTTSTFDDDSLNPRQLSLTRVPTSTYDTSRPSLLPTGPCARHCQRPRTRVQDCHRRSRCLSSAISLFCGIVYCLFRFCPPVRNRWTAWKINRKQSRQKENGYQ